jgi:predicted dehydrogenase
MKKLRIGIIGAGRIAEAHAEGYRKLKDRVEMTALVDAHLENAQAKAKAWNIEHVYENVDALLAANTVDAVDICLPHHLHAEVVQKACEAKKHILLEKPMARSLAEAEVILEAVQAAGVMLMVAHNHVFNPIVQKAKEIIQKELIGRVHLVKATSLGWFFFTPQDFRMSREKTGGGVFVDTGVHFVYILQFLLGDVQSVTTVQGNLVREEMEGEDTAIVSLRFERGAIGEITVSYASLVPEWEKGFPAGWEQTVYLLGTKGALRFSLTENTLWLYSETEMPSTLKPSSGWTKIQIDHAYATSFQTEVAHFVDCLQTSTCPLVGGEEGRKALEVVEAAYRSAKESRTIYLDKRTT